MFFYLSFLSTFKKNRLSQSLPSFPVLNTFPLYDYDINSYVDSFWDSMCVCIYLKKIPILPEKKRLHIIENEIWYHLFSCWIKTAYKKLSKSFGDFDQLYFVCSFYSAWEEMISNFVFNYIFVWFTQIFYHKQKRGDFFQRNPFS